ncbi:MAG: hypothetical protein ACI9VT_004121, partial [Psychroserpens sp.]
KSTILAPASKCLACNTVLFVIVRFTHVSCFI